MVTHEYDTPPQMDHLLRRLHCLLYALDQALKTSQLKVFSSGAKTRTTTAPSFGPMALLTTQVAIIPEWPIPPLSYLHSDPSLDTGIAFLIYNPSVSTQRT